MSQQRLSIKDYQFNYSWKGKPGQPIILFLHGFMGDRDDFDPAISFLGDRFCCLTIDLPGHGYTKVYGQDSCYSMAQTARALIELLEELEIEQCFLVGYSMGGRLALYLIIYFPQYFFKAILESASPGLATAKEREQRIKQDLNLAAELESVNLAIFLERWYRNPLFISLRKHPHFSQVYQKRIDNNPLQLAKSLRNLSTGIQPSLWQELIQNTVPTLLIVGGLDRKFMNINSRMAEMNQIFDLQIIGNSGHNIHWEEPAIFAAAVQKFFT